MRTPHVALLVAALVIGVGCKPATTGTNPTPTPKTTVPTGPPSTDVAAAEITHYWEGDWGRLMLRQVGGEIVGVYDHNLGTIVGTFDGGVLKGWWCEGADRTSSGEVEFRFKRTDEGQLFLDGRWRSGSEGDWNEDWDLVPSKGEAPAELVGRFEQPALFCRHP